MKVNNISFDNDSEERTVLYEENAPSSSLFQWMIVTGGFVLGMFYFFTFFFSLVEKTDKYISPLFILIFYSLIMWDFFSMKFRITNLGVEVALPPFRYSIPFSEIDEVKTRGSIPWYWGWGVRMWGKDLAFISMHKSTVVIMKKTGFFRNVVMTTTYPGEFLQRIRRKMG